MNPRDIKRQANAIRKCRTGEAYYDRKYKDLRVADLLLVLEDENWHTEETLIEALVQMDYYAMVELCKIIVKHEEVGYLPSDLYERVHEIDEKLRGKKKDLTI